jgi:glucosamine kinase
VSRLALGIDAGGTHTRCLVVDERGCRRGVGTAAGANPNSSGDVSAAFVDALRAVTRRAPGDPPPRFASAVVAVAGAGTAGRPAVERAVRSAAGRLGIEFDALHVCTDCEAAFAAGSTEPDGTVLIAGTGSIAAAIAGFGIVGRRDGHGYLLGDAGSALWIAAAGVRAVLADLEGAGPSTDLRAPVIAAVRADPVVRARPDAGDLDDAQAILAATYAHPPASLAALAPLVERAAATGDAIAVRIVDDAVAALVRTVAAVRAGPGPLVVTGGVAAGSGLIGTAVRAALAAEFGAPPRTVADGGVRGAAALAVRRLPGVPTAVADQLVDGDETSTASRTLPAV